MGLFLYCKDTNKRARNIKFQRENVENIYFFLLIADGYSLRLIGLQSDDHEYQYLQMLRIGEGCFIVLLQQILH